MTLTADERRALEHAIGAGLVEFGGPFVVDEPVITACRKLGIDPKDWHGRSMLPSATEERRADDG